MNIQDEILTSYEIRKSNKEKTAFIEYMKKRLERAGYKPEDIKVEEKGSGLFRSRNIVVGDPEKAKVLFGGHYDTCAWMPFPNLLAPTNPILFLGYQVVLVFVLFFIAALAGFLVGRVTDNAEVAYWTSLASLILLMIQLLVGYRNKHTANDNTSGIITLTQILETLPAEDRDKVCVIYFDNEEKGLFGSAFFYRKHRKQVKNKLLINLDCVGDGTQIVTMADARAKNDSFYQSFVTALEQKEPEFEVVYVQKRMLPLMFPSDQANFRKGIGVCALKKSVLGFRYVARIHTVMDTKCRKTNVEYLTAAMQKFVEDL